FGCTDIEACNFDELATEDDGSCYYEDTVTCYEDIDGDGYYNDVQDYTACDAVCSDLGEAWSSDAGSGEELFGCTDIEACNFDELATEDDGSCYYEDTVTCYEDIDGDGYYNDVQDYTACDAVCSDLGEAWSSDAGLGEEIYGCSDPVADNYDDTVTEDDGSCEYAPEASFTTDVTEGYAPLTVTFTNTSDLGSGSDVTYLWDFGDGDTSTEENPEHTFVINGEFSVTLTVETTHGIDTTDPTMISVNVFYGDVDQNGIVQALDASKILKYLADYIELDDIQLMNADVSLDGTVSALDATIILQYLVNIIPELPYSEPLLASGEMHMSDQQIEAGEMADIPLYLADDDNILSFEYIVNYDPEILTFVEVAWSETATFTTEVNPRDGEIIFVGARTEAQDVVDIMATLRFEVADNFEGDSETVVNVMNLRWNEESVITDAASATLTPLLSIADYAIPAEFGLNQNYPNPFNPTTTISFDIPELSDVRIDIYNVLGQKVKTLVDANYQPGYHSVQWDGYNDRGQSEVSGIYIYTISADGYRETHKMLMIK
ncbi:MAG: PKD domain-containing protein, partial [Candidatus Marinimicrobia bacterium]|nr:PKD domain-containing protein [Candidatus Neomarinimicrobiota bacterium]